MLSQMVWMYESKYCIPSVTICFYVFNIEIILFSGLFADQIDVFLKIFMVDAKNNILCGKTHFLKACHIAFYFS